MVMTLRREGIHIALERRVYAAATRTLPPCRVNTALLSLINYRSGSVMKRPSGGRCPAERQKFDGWVDLRPSGEAARRKARIRRENAEECVP